MLRTSLLANCKQNLRIMKLFGMYLANKNLNLKQNLNDYDFLLSAKV